MKLDATKGKGASAPRTPRPNGPGQCVSVMFAPKLNRCGPRLCHHLKELLKCIRALWCRVILWTSAIFGRVGMK